jgi:photosystem II stability/assembly factor-like uncharacterized protein
VIGDAGTILKSTDAGQTWSALDSGTTQTLYDVYFFTGDHGLVVGDGGLIRQTVDGGATWTTLASGVRDSLRSISFNGSNGICGGLSQDMLYSSDEGGTWKVSQKGFFGGGFFGAHMISPTVGFVSGQNSIFQALAGVTVDGGVTWNFYPFYFNGNEGAGDDVFFFDDMTGVTSGVLFDNEGAISRTGDGAVDWSSTLFPNGIQGIDFPSPSAGYAVGFFGTILKSGDLGITWTPQASGTSSDLFDVHFLSDQIGIAVGAGGTLLRTTNGGEPDDLALLAAASRKKHFDIDLPLTGAPGIECRDGRLKVAFTFNHPIASVDEVTTSCGSVDQSLVDNSDPTTFLVILTDAQCNTEYVTLTLTGIHDDEGNSLSATTVTLGTLRGDINGDGFVNGHDTDALVAARGQETDETNFRADLNSDGRIDSSDAKLLRPAIGTHLPP